MNPHFLSNSSILPLRYALLSFVPHLINIAKMTSLSIASNFIPRIIIIGAMLVILYRYLGNNNHYNVCIFVIY